MGVQPDRSFTAADSFTAYDRQGVDRFFVDAVERRATLLSGIATLRRRIADAEAALAGSSDPEFRCIRAVLEGQRQLRDEARANEQAVAAVAASAEAQVERIMASARFRAEQRTASLDPRVRGGGGPGRPPALHTGSHNGTSGAAACGGPSVFP